MHRPHSRRASRLNSHAEIETLTVSSTTPPLGLFAKVNIPPSLEEEEISLVDRQAVYRVQYQKDCEWIAENMVDFVRDLSSSYSMLSYDNAVWKNLLKNPEKLLNNGYPAGVSYRWKNSEGEPPMVLEVNNYVATLCKWTEERFEDESIFPSDVGIPFPLDFKENHARNIMNRMLRGFNIILCNPTLHGFDDAKPSDSSNDFKVIALRFITFGLHWQLFDEKELRCINDFVITVEKCFEAAKQVFYKEKKETLLKDIKKSKKYDNVNNFLYLTEKQAKIKLNISTSVLNQLIKIWAKESWLKVVKRGNERRLCFTHIRKLSPDV